MSDPVSRSPVVNPTYPVKPAQPAREKERKERRRERPPRHGDGGGPEDSGDEHKRIDEYI